MTIFEFKLKVVVLLSPQVESGVGFVMLGTAKTFKAKSTIEKTNNVFSKAWTLYKPKVEEKKNFDNKKQLDAAIAKEILENGEKKWMVQVALAANQNKASTIQSRLEAKGYKVVTSATTKGIRVMVDPANDYAIAQIIREKIIADNSLNMPSAWVFKWASLTPQ